MGAVVRLAVVRLVVVDTTGVRLCVVPPVAGEAGAEPEAGRAVAGAISYKK